MYLAYVIPVGGGSPDNSLPSLPPGISMPGFPTNPIAPGGGVVPPYFPGNPIAPGGGVAPPLFPGNPIAPGGPGAGVQPPLFPGNPIVVPPAGAPGSPTNPIVLPGLPDGQVAVVAIWVPGVGHVAVAVTGKVAAPIYPTPSPKT